MICLENLKAKYLRRKGRIIRREKAVKQNLEIQDDLQMSAWVIIKDNELCHWPSLQFQSQLRIKCRCY